MNDIYSEAFRNLVELLEALETNYNWQYIIVGGVLTPLYAQIRMTQDIDVVLLLQLTDASKDALLKQIVAHDFKPFTTWDDAVFNWPNLSMITFLDPSEKIKIDINILEEGKNASSIYEKIGILSIARRIRKDFLGTECWVQTKEDFIIAKLVYAGILDYNDALACWIKYENEMDIDYLESSAGQLGITASLVALKEKRSVEDVYPD